LSEDWDKYKCVLELAATICTIETADKFYEWVIKWIHDNTTPLSNLKNVVKVEKDKHVIH
jgi:hypothetical protein